MAYRNVHAIAQCASMNATNRNSTRIIRVVERGNKHLWSALYLLWSRDYFDDFIEKIVDIVGRFLPIFCHPSVFGATVNNGKVELFFRCIEREHQVEDHFVDFFGPTIRLIHLVYHHNRLQSDLQGFL